MTSRTKLANPYTQTQKAMAGFREKLQKWRDRKGGARAQLDAASVASSAKGSNDIQQERPGYSLVDPANREESPTTQSLWDRAYDALGKDKTQLVEKYEKLLSKEAQTTSSAVNNGPVRAISPDDVTLSPNNQSRQAQLKIVIEQGLRRMEETKTRYTIAGHEFVLTDQISQAAGFVLWAKDWIGDAIQASPQASIAWAGVCLILPLLTNLKTTEDANRDGFTYVTTRMHYYAALEPLLLRLSQNPGVADGLMAEANSHIVDLYQHILEFQIRSVLRFYQSRLKGYAGDVFRPRDWQQIRLGINTLEETVNKDLGQINEFLTRQELEILNKTSINALGAIKGFLSVSTEQLAVLKEQLAIQQDAVRKKQSDEQKKCLQLFRLTSSDKDVTYEWYKDRVEDRLQGTCQWFLQHDHFQRWLAQESGPLLVSADPGCGKSVLAKYLIDHELSQQSATICYYFFKDQDQNTVRQALCALLHQLFSQIPALIGHAMEPYAKEGPGLIHSTKSLWTIFTSAVHDPQAGPVIVVLDALDECADEQYQDLIRNMESQISRDSNRQPGHVRLKFLMTSRPYERVISEFQDLVESFPLIHIPGEDESKTISLEVNLVIQNRVNRLARKKKLSAETKNCLTDKLLGIQHRTYLWVYLVFDYLETKTLLDTAKSVEAAIATLPKTVNDAYEQILSKSEQDPIVRRILSVILAAKRPLTLPEMNVVVNMDDEINKKIESSTFGGLMLGSDKSFRFHLRSLCGLFVSVHHNNIYFLHQTAREFLLRTDKSPSSVTVSSEIRWHHSITIYDANAVLAKLCVLYLSFFTSNTILLPKEDPRFALLNYSAGYWGTHFHEAGIIDDAAIVPLASGICESNSTSYLVWSNIYCNEKTAFGYPIVWASFLGNVSVARLLLENGADVDAKGRLGRTPLSLAAGFGLEALAQVLLENGADVEAKDNDGQTPLSLTAERGHEAVARLLLENGADVEAKNGDGWTPLLFAADRGHEVVARLLLENGADVKARTNDGRTPLSLATERRHEAVVKLLGTHVA